MTQEQGGAQSPEQALQALILDPDLERLEDLLADFNLFDVLGIARRELQHSAFLAWLLDPRGSHGLRDYFLRGFLSVAATEARERGTAPFTPLDVDGWNLSDVEVAAERHNIDILMIGESDKFVCLIENKIGTGEHSGQLSRYMSTVETEYRGLTPFPVFLTPNGAEPEEESDAERYVPLDYGKIAVLIDRVLETRRSTISVSVTSFLEQYAQTLRRHVLDNTDNIDELAYRVYSNHRDAIDLIINAQSVPGTMAYRIYSNHRDAIDLIINAQSVPGTMAWRSIDAVMKAYDAHLLPDEHQKGIRRFYATELEEIPDLKKGEHWTGSGRILLFEYKRYRKALDLVLGPGPEETRRRLKDLAQRDGFPGASRGSQKWSYIYRKAVLSEEGPRPLDAEEVRSQVEQAVAEFFKEDYWPLVNAIRDEFGLPPASAG